MSLPGLVLAALVRLAGGSWALRAGVLEAWGPPAAWLLKLHPLGRVIACTIGHVVIGRDDAALARTRAHEREHVRQCERWGVLFPFLYLAQSLRQWVRGANPYLDNRFEVAAHAAERRETFAKPTA
jgi:hypothetical protein